MGEAWGCLIRSRGSAAPDVIIFGIGDDWLARAACNAILVQGIGMYLVNLNIWTHNILTLLARSRVRPRALRASHPIPSAGRASQPAVWPHTACVTVTPVHLLQGCLRMPVVHACGLTCTPS